MKPSILLVPLAAVAMRLPAEQAFIPPPEVRQIALADVLAASASATGEAYPDADTIVIDSVSCEAYNEDGTSVLFDDTYTKVLTEKGRRAESTSSIGFNAFYTDLSIVAAEIIKPDGTTIPIDLERNCQTSIDTGMMSANIYDPDDKVTTVSFPNLEIGDMTRLAIVKTEKKARVPGVWADYQTFELFDPILRYTYSISCPTNLPVRSIVLRDEVPGTMVAEAFTGLLMHRVTYGIGLFRPSGDMSVQDRREHTVAAARIFPVQPDDQILYVLTPRIAVSRTGIFKDRKLIAVLKADDIGFVNIHQRSDHSQIHAVQISDRRKAEKAAFVDQRKHHGLNNIVFMVCISHFIAAQFLGTGIQGTFSKFRTERTRVRFFPDIENDFRNFRRNTVKRDI